MSSVSQPAIMGGCVAMYGDIPKLASAILSAGGADSHLWRRFRIGVTSFITLDQMVSMRVPVPAEMSDRALEPLTVDPDTQLEPPCTMATPYCRAMPSAAATCSVMVPLL